MKAFYQLSKEEVLQQLKTSPQGLDFNVVASLQAEYGKNVLLEAKQKTKLSILFAQLADIMILILVIAGVISFVVGEHTDAFIILAIIVANAWMGYSQEYNAEQSI